MKKELLAIAVLALFIALIGCINVNPPAGTTPTPVITTPPAIFTPTPIATPAVTPETTPAATPTPQPTHTLTPVITPTPLASSTPAPTSSTPIQTPTPQPTQVNANPRLLMLGRSVTENWANWMNLEYDGEGYSGAYNGVQIKTRQIESPPELPTSADYFIEEYAAETDVVFFKLCFVDFTTDPQDLARNKWYVEHVYQTAVVRNHKKLMVGNALPMLESDTPPELVDAHLEYNEWLEGFADSRLDVCVLNLYELLSTPGGNLMPEYSLSPGDSHLNGAAYSVITPRLMAEVRDCR